MKILFKISVVLIIYYLLLIIPISLAEEINPNDVLSHRAQLEQELKKLEEQIDGYRNVISDKQKQATTLGRDIAIMDANIAKIKLEIRLIDVRVAQLSDNISKHNISIKDLGEKIIKEKDSLSELLRRTNEMDAASMVEMVFGYDNLSDFFVEVDSFESINRAMQDSLLEITDTKSQTEKEKEELEDKREEQLGLKTVQEIEKKRLTDAENEKKKILKATKGEEEKYQKILTERQKDATKIRSQLFLLTGSPAIPFEKAVEYATFAWKVTGVRPAFLLGVIAEESNLGANVGTGNWNIDLANSKCAKQRVAFTAICSELGFDPNLMPVSKKAWYGYCGGAMGPAQFMPTTWQLYKNRISAITGVKCPNPWDPKDAFVASALLLKDNGATDGGTKSERIAALKYLAGARWNKSAYSFYGDDVMELATKYQNMIDIITK